MPVLMPPKKAKQAKPDRRTLDSLSLEECHAVITNLILVSDDSDFPDSMTTLTSDIVDEFWTKVREERRQFQKRKAGLKESALSKLSEDEKKALDI